MTENNKTYYVPSTHQKREVTLNQKWFLGKRAETEQGKNITPRVTCFKALINGQDAFGEVYERIAAATSSIDIAIWGFQPSMHFKRDGHSLCIGDLLIKKALEGVKVRILVWSMAGDIQTFSEANLGNKPGVIKGRVEGVTLTQLTYDYAWFYSIQGKLDKGSLMTIRGIDWRNDVARQYEIDFPGAAIPSHYSTDEHLEQYDLLLEFSTSPSRTNLVYKNRSVMSQPNQYYDDPNVPDEIKGFEDKNLPSGAKDGFLKYAPSHHQKMVLIDAEKINSQGKASQAVGFVMEHNMLDNYWDTSEHSLRIFQPNKGKNSPTPYQDVSSIVIGGVLWDLNYNFCQSWDRKTNKQWGNDPSETNLTAQRQGLTPESFDLHSSDIDIPNGHRLMAQILRTYDSPDVENIKEMYMNNISNITSYIYTENQYFRFPPLAKKFIENWQRFKSAGRQTPIHWFVITNSTDAGIGDGTYTTNNMFKILGRQDVMPNVAKNIRLSELQSSLRILSQKALGITNILGVSIQELGNLEKIKSEINDVQAEIARVQAIDTKPNNEKGSNNEKEPNTEHTENQDLTKELGYELVDTSGIKVHICTLMPKDENGRYVNTYKGKTAEVYVHSKVTIMDDTCTVISSANLNTRSMQIDTELGIVLEYDKVARELRKNLWNLHTNNNRDANPDEMHDPEIANMAFNEWENIITKNKKLQTQKSSNPDCSLREFYRADPDVSTLD